jgi:hypothetical protein
MGAELGLGRRHALELRLDGHAGPLEYLDGSVGWTYGATARAGVRFGR